MQPLPLSANKRPEPTALQAPCFLTEVPEEILSDVLDPFLDDKMRARMRGTNRQFALMGRGHGCRGSNLGQCLHCGKITPWQLACKFDPRCGGWLGEYHHYCMHCFGSREGLPCQSTYCSCKYPNHTAPQWSNSFECNCQVCRSAPRNQNVNFDSRLRNCQICHLGCGKPTEWVMAYSINSATGNWIISRGHRYCKRCFRSKEQHPCQDLNCGCRYPDHIASQGCGCQLCRI